MKKNKFNFEAGKYFTSFILPEYRNLSAYNDAESKSFMSLLPSYELINEPAVSV